MAAFSVKTEPDLEVKPTLEDQKTQPEPMETSSFCFETVVKEEVMIEEERVPSEEKCDNKRPADDAPDRTKTDLFCGDCNKSFTTLAKFNKHMYKDRNLKERKYTCQICDKAYRDKYALTIHLQGVHLVAKLVKPIGSKSKKAEESDEPDGKQFSKTMTSETGRFKCSECDERFEFRYLQQRHIWRHNILKQELYKCEECNKAFATPNEFKSHMQRAHEKHAQKGSDIFVKEEEEDGVFRCSKCDRSFEERHLCQRHILRHLFLMKEKAFACSKCPKTFKFEKYLEKHEAWHEAVILKQRENVKCDECNRQFKNKRILTRHMQRHKAMQEGKYQCTACNERLPTQRELNAHAAKHGKVKDMPEGYQPPIIIERNNHSAFKCPDCGMVFSVRRVYKNHAERHIHMRNGTYTCKLCEKACGSENNLYTHLRRHQTGEVKVDEPRDLPFECAKCAKRFGKKHLLVRHLKMHLAMENGLYKCKICGKYLGSSASLAIHVQGHEDNKGMGKYKCAECDRSYDLRGSYVSHVKRMHGINKLKQEDDVKTEES